MYYINMYSNMKYYENVCDCLRVIQQSKNRKLKNENCWQQTSLSLHLFNFFVLIFTVDVIEANQVKNRNITFCKVTILKCAHF